MHNQLLQVIFTKQLSRKQWISLIILTVGCIIKQLSTSERGLGKGTPVPEAGVTKLLASLSSVYTLLLLVQVIV